MAVRLQQNQAELAALAPRRKILYSFLSEAFAEPPTPSGLAALREPAFVAAISRILRQDTVSSLLQDSDAASPSAMSQDALRRAFTSLFKVPGPEYIAPYESVFRDSREVNGQPVRGLLMGPSAVDVQRWYRLAAVDIVDTCKELPDHIALELNFLAHLCGKEETFLANDDEPHLIRAWEMERDFLSTHVVCWVPKLRDNVCEKCEHAYFRAIAGMAVEFTHADLRTLESVIGPFRGGSVLPCERVALDGKP